MKRVILAPNPTGTGHNMRMLAIGKQLKEVNKELEITVLLGAHKSINRTIFYLGLQ